MADYSSPRPSDPIDYRRDAFLHIECGCGRRSVCKLGEFARFNRLPGDLALYRMIARLRCRMCGKRPSRAEVKRYGR